MGAERKRVEGFGQLENGLRQASPWYWWGPYVSERQWGTVREDYSADGDAWAHFPHDHARSRAYRWGEDGLAGFCDIEQNLCLGLALWNGRDPILKERIFGLAGPEGNHGEDAKEYWWYLDAVPSHAWNRWRYHYPQAAFPYDDLVAENARRGRLDPEYELLDTGVFDDDRYWAVEVEYAKADPTDLLMTVTVTNAGPDTDELHLLPHAWFRNTWSWEPGAVAPELRAASHHGADDAETAGDGAGGVERDRDRDRGRDRDQIAGSATIDIDHPWLGELELRAGPGPDGTAPTLLFCRNETNAARFTDPEAGNEPANQPANEPGNGAVSPDATTGTAYPKDGIGNHVLHGAPTVDPARRGTKAAAWYRLTVAPGDTVELRLRLRHRSTPPASGDPGRARRRAPRTDDLLGRDHDKVRATRRAEADEFYAELTPAGTSDDEAAVMRQAFAGLLWSKQLFAYDVERWLDGDPGQPAPPPERTSGRNARWRTFNAFDVMAMPDPWEYPWFAAWDLAFHCVAFAHIDPAFAKYQLVLLCREWFQHPNGALPAYEWNFDDVNPPVQAWAALEVFLIDGERDPAFLRRVFDKLLINFTWWVNREDADGSNVFEGGFLGLDNIGPIDRDRLPVAGVLEQSDATAWMALYSLHMAAIASLLHQYGEPTLDLVLKFLEQFTLIRDAMDGSDLWDQDDGFYYDRLLLPDGSAVPIRVRSMVGILPLLASVVVDERAIRRAENVRKQFAHFLGRDGTLLREAADRGQLRGEPGDRRLLLGAVSVEHLVRVLRRVFDEDEFLSPHGVRALSRWHRDHPYELSLGDLRATIDYEPAESTTPMFGGNSNWRGPVWFPVNYLLVSALRSYGQFFGDDLRMEYPVGSATYLTLHEIADDLRRRLVSLFLLDDGDRRDERGRDDGDPPAARRPCWGDVATFQGDPAWRDHLLFHEYFHGDTGAGLGASHQTGWTALVADLIRRRPDSEIRSLSTVLLEGPRTRSRNRPGSRRPS